MSKVHLTDTDPQAIVARPTRKGAFAERAADDLLERLAKRAPVILIKDEGSRSLVGPAELTRAFYEGRMKR